MAKYVNLDDCEVVYCGSDGDYEKYNIPYDMPTLDMVEIVRCKDCLHYENGFCYNPNTYDDEKTRGNTIPNWFCADGKRKTDD